MVFRFAPWRLADVAVQVAEPAAPEESFEFGAGNKEMPAAAANAKLPPQVMERRFGQAQELTKFPITKAIVLATDVVAAGNCGLNNGVEREVADGGGIVNLARPETQLATAAGTGRYVPYPEIAPGFDQFIDAVDREA